MHGIAAIQMSLSSSGLGRGPFKAKTRVRIPLGALQDNPARNGVGFFFDFPLLNSC